VDDVLEHFGDPIAGKGDEDNQADDFGARAAAGALCACRVGAGLVFDVDGDEGDGEPGAEGGGEEPADEGDEVNVAEALGNVDAAGSLDRRSMKSCEQEAYLVCSMRALKGMRGIHVTKHTTVKMEKMRKTMPPE